MDCVTSPPHASAIIEPTTPSRSVSDNTVINSHPLKWSCQITPITPITPIQSQTQQINDGFTMCNIDDEKSSTINSHTNI